MCRAEPEPEAQATTRAVVLVVEDDPEMNELERQLLEARGLDAIGALTGVEAVRLAEQNGLDGVLLDLMLPEMDGFETCRRLRAASDVPIVILTALDSEECRQRGLNAGASAYFTKPFDPDEVIEALRDLIDDRRRSGAG